MRLVRNDLNGLSQRISKLTGGVTTSFRYGLAGELLTETRSGAAREYVYLDGRPLAMLDPDRDGDGISDATDNCFGIPNPDQRDTNGDGYGNRCDADLDQSGFVDSADLAIFKSRFGTNNADADFDGSGFVNAADVAILKLLLGKVPGPSGIYTPPAAALRFLHTDHLGTPIAATNEQGAKTWHAVHDPFGNATVFDDPDNDGQKLTLNLRFPGQYYDEETGLHYNWHRYYDPKTGRYLSSDPIGLDGGLNTYAYVENNPLRFIDPLGLAFDDPGNASIYPPTTNCACVINCVLTAEGSKLCRLLPNKNPRIGDVEIPINLPQRLCEETTKQVRCEKKCEKECRGPDQCR